MLLLAWGHYKIRTFPRITLWNSTDPAPPPWTTFFSSLLDSSVRPLLTPHWPLSVPLPMSPPIQSPSFLYLSGSQRPAVYQLSSGPISSPETFPDSTLMCPATQLRSLLGCVISISNARCPRGLDSAPQPCLPSLNKWHHCLVNCSSKESNSYPWFFSFPYTTENPTSNIYPKSTAFYLTQPS